MLLEQTSERDCRVSGSANGRIGTACRTITHYRVDSASTTYVFSRTTVPHDHLLNVTTNAPVKYAIKGAIVYLLDEDGKQHTLDLIEKIRRPEQEPK